MCLILSRAITTFQPVTINVNDYSAIFTVAASVCIVCLYNRHCIYTECMEFSCIHRVDNVLAVEVAVAEVLVKKIT